jgi:hypothetical protein
LVVFCRQRSGILALLASLLIVPGTSIHGWRETLDANTRVTRTLELESIERSCDLFFTAREVGQGVGLGLPICHAIVAAHDGALTVERAHDEANTPTSRV